MTLEVTNATDNPDGEHYVDIKNNGDILVSVDAHNGDPPTVTICEPARQEDALLTLTFTKDGNLDEWRE